MSEEEIRHCIDGHNRRNAELEKLLLRKGIHPDEPLDVECHFWADTQESAALLARALYERGFLVLDVSRSSDDERWNVEARISQSTRATTDEKFTDALVRLASEYSATYGGWETSVPDLSRGPIQ